MVSKENKAAFLKGLGELSTRLGVVLTGCTDGSCHCSMSIEVATGIIEYEDGDGCGAPKRRGSKR